MKEQFEKIIKNEEVATLEHEAAVKHSKIYPQSKGYIGMASRNSFKAGIYWQKQQFAKQQAEIVKAVLKYVAENAECFLFHNGNQVINNKKYKYHANIDQKGILNMEEDILKGLKDGQI